MIKPCLFFLSVFCFYFPASAQVRQGIEAPNTMRESLANSPLLLEVYSNYQVVYFNLGDDFKNPKTAPSYFQLRVKAPALPWVITANLAQIQKGFSSAKAPREQVSNLIGLRTNRGEVIHLSQTPQVIIWGDNGPAEQYFTIDLVIDPPFNLLPGDIQGIVNFQLQLQ